MEKQICSIWDAKAEAWLPPMFFLSIGQAARSFEDAVNSEGEFQKHPEDYTLFKIGTFNEHSGELKGIVPIEIVRGLGVVKNGNS